MGLFGFGKKKEEKPEVSRLPELPEDSGDLSLPSIKNLPGFQKKEAGTEKNILPSLPNSDFNKNLNQTAIKNVIEKPSPDMQKSKFGALPLIKPEFGKEYEEFGRLKPLKMPEIKREPARMQGFIKPSVKKAEPIYVRLDKFKTTVEAFEEIKDKIMEIEEFLNKTKEIKLKEDQELEKWEQEIQLIKTRINSIDKDIFNELD